eukprot:scaffold8234_cov116-Skeletonema_marinoi.AAC.4
MSPSLPITCGGSIMNLLAHIHTCPTVENKVESKDSLGHCRTMQLPRLKSIEGRFKIVSSA